LVVDNVVGYQDVAACAQIEAIRVMGSWKATTDRIRCVSCRIVQEQILHYHIGATGDTEQMSGPVLDVQVLDH
jgi:hypothetical protein